MPVTLSIKNVPDDVVERLRQRAKLNRRSLQGELLATIEETAAEPHSTLTIAGLSAWARTRDFSGTGNSTEDIRRHRDERAEASLSPARRPRRRRTPTRRGRR